MNTGSEPERQNEMAGKNSQNHDYMKCFPILSIKVYIQAMEMYTN